MSKLPTNVEDSYLSPKEAADVVGVIRPRMAQLIGEERVVEVTKTTGGYRNTPIRKVFGGWRIPKDFRILRGVRERPGAVSDYIRKWEKAHPEVLEYERLESERRAEKERQRLQEEKSLQNTPETARGSFLAPTN